MAKELPNSTMVDELTGEELEMILQAGNPMALYGPFIFLAIIIAI